MSERPTRLGVLERATLILDAFADAPGPLGLDDIAEITELPRTTVFRLLTTLRDLGWVHHDRRGYAPGRRLSAPTPDAEHLDLRAAASVTLNDLQLATDAVVHLSVLDGPVVHYLDKVGGARATTIPSRVGGRIIATDSVSGLAMLAVLAPEQVDTLVGRPDRTADGLAPLHHELAAVRRRKGIAILDGLPGTGITSMATAVPGPRGHRPLAAISVARRGHLPLPVVGPLLLAAARTTSRTLYPQWVPPQRGAVLRLA
ncbi:IclR family transcriptional regulator [Nocardioides sp. R1-1]|uniref:IclR family transcriptional regulator n=1 Tax=Nocardioides sp. R1-1 TaxID=3383502 RepID=UPI0038D1E6B0